MTAPTIIDAEVTFPELTETAAQDLTDRINATADDLAGMIQRAHEGRAWAALGYETWKAYVQAELRMSERRAFQLLDFAEIRSQLNNCSVPPTTESVTRPLKVVEPAKRAKVYEAAIVKAGGNQPTAKQVGETIVEVFDPESFPPIRNEEPIATTVATEVCDDELSDEEWEAMLAKSKAWSLAQNILRLIEGMPLRDQMIHEALREIDKKIREKRDAAWEAQKQ